MKPIRYEPNSASISVNRFGATNAPAQAWATDNWNVAAILCGDDNFHLSRGSFFGSRSLDGTVLGFWPILWESLNICWVPKMHCPFVDWPYRAVGRKNRILTLEGKGLARPFVNIEGYSNRTALVLIKNTLKPWLEDNRGFRIFIGGPGARARNVHTARHYIRCFGEIRFRNSGRNCVVDAACNAAFLLLW